MSCNCNNDIIKSTSLTLVAGTSLTINIPANVFTNKERLILLICQAIPANATTERVYIKAGSSTAVEVRSRNGNYLRADQIRTRTLYSMVYGNDPIHFSLTCPVRCSSFVVTTTAESEEPGED